MEERNLLGETGIIIALLLVLLPVIAAAVLVMIRARAVLGNYLHRKRQEKFNEYLKGLTPEEIQELEQRKKELDFSLSNNELSGDRAPKDSRGLIQNIGEADTIRFVEKKKKGQPRPNIDPALTKLILWYLGCATFWLLFGTSVGEYLGIKFVAPDADHLSWLSFGRLRPVHTNAVFWGWASLAMMGLGYYVIPRVSNVPIVSLKKGYISLILANASVVIGSICLMAGINNGGGEYREYVWPVMALFGVAVALSLDNFLRTIARRTTREIYVSNWYIISAMMFMLVIAVAAYWPTWQNGLGETIVQGYYMHQAVGMWFMLFSLGLMYYFLPQQLNKPIYSYSLGILAFWTQILFYTLIGTHHFIFSAIPWWLQTVAIVGSMGMVIPVVAGTTNFLMTFNGSWGKLSGSYTLPFYLIGIIFYFTGSLQGTAQAFRFTNLIWHFTDFTVAHSHLTMYGIISFMLWGFIYTIVPRLTGKEPPQTSTGAHFWLALIGLLFYTFPLMYGSTMRGIMWLDGLRPFIESVEMMAPYWLWRAIGGSLMWLSHILFAYNFYVMVKGKDEEEIPESPQEILNAKQAMDNQTATA
jgi:cytochrome c oxidase cbb3-type subunit 1